MKSRNELLCWKIETMAKGFFDTPEFTGEDLKMLIKECGYTYKEFAEIMHISEPKVKRMVYNGLKIDSVTSFILKTFYSGLNPQK